MGGDAAAAGARRCNRNAGSMACARCSVAADCVTCCLRSEFTSLFPSSAAPAANPSSLSSFVPSSSGRTSTASGGSSALQHLASAESAGGSGRYAAVNACDVSGECAAAAACRCP